MKTTTSIFFVLLSTLTASAQVKQGFEVETQGGYEYNYFKSPEVVRQDGVIFTEADLISSSVYQDIKMDYDYRYKWGRNRIRLSATPATRLFYENFQDSYWSLNATAKYDYEINGNTKFLTQLSFKRMDREGLDGAQDILINPLGYLVYGANTGIEFKAFPNNRTTLKAFYNFTDFDAFGIRDLQFDEFGVQLSTRQVFEVNNLKHSYGLTAYVKKRLYDTFNASDVITDGERDWSYAKATAYYEYPIGETFEIEPSLVYYVRVDNMADRSGFRQFGPALRLKFDNDKTSVRSYFKYLTRNYTSFEARDNNGPTGEKIQYNYADIALDAEHRLGSTGFSITAKVYSRIRTTNYTDIDARSFRGYSNQYAGIGLKWEL